MWKHKNFINLQLCAGETWVLNETLTSQSFGIVDVAFSSNGSDYTRFARYYKTDMLGEVEQDYVAFYTSDTNYVEVYDNGTWSDQAYRTITFATAPTGDLLTWLQANGTKQTTPQPTLTFKHFYDAGTIGSGTYKFRHYSQQEPSSGETWVLNENAYDPINNFTYTADFVCDDVNYSKIVNSNNPMSGGLFYDTTKVVNPDNATEFISEAYRTLTFAIPPTGDLLTWLQANGTKQDGGGVISAGTYIFNESLTAPQSGNISAEFIAKGNSLTADNVYGSQIDIEGLSVLDNGYLTLNGTNDLIEWDLYYWQYQHKVAEEDYVTYTATDNTKLRTIIFENDQNADFYTWFTANTTKLS